MLSANTIKFPLLLISINFINIYEGVKQHIKIRQGFKRSIHSDWLETTKLYKECEPFRALSQIPQNSTIDAREENLDSAEKSSCRLYQVKLKRV